VNKFIKDIYSIYGRHYKSLLKEIPGGASVIKNQEKCRFEDL